MNNQSRDRTGKYGFSGDYGRICKCGHNLGTHTAEPPHICGSNGTGLVDCACMKFVPTPPPEETVLRDGYDYIWDESKLTWKVIKSTPDNEKLIKLIDELILMRIAWANARIWGEGDLEESSKLKVEKVKKKLSELNLASLLAPKYSKQAVKVKAVTK